MGETSGFEADLCDFLLRQGKLDERGLQRARRALEGSSTRLTEVLSQLGMVSERDLAEAMAGVSGLPILARGDYPAEPILDGALSSRFLRDALVLPIEDSGVHIAVAMAHPMDRFTIDALRLATGREIAPVIAIPSELMAALDRLYGDKPDPAKSAATEGGDLWGDVDIDRLRDLASEAPVVRFVDQMIARAFAQNASDIHIEPFEDRIRVRYRIDGRLQEEESLPYALRLAVVSRIKIMAGLNIAERRQPQDGRIQTAVEGRSLDVRVATAPTLHGESLALRLLHRDHARLDLSKLGFSKKGIEVLECALDRPHGLLLVTGPTGSGKTTTLYAALSRLNIVARKILTVEDPIEYQLSGVNQVQVNPKFGLTFANVLRSFLRHDPDVIMVGEIRDAETAEIAVHASLTGHLVLATLHTNNAASALTRLIEMGVEDFLLTSTVTAVVAQRLVRTLCLNCRAARAPETVDLGDLGVAGRRDAQVRLAHAPRGCEACRGTGFSGRTTIAEVMAMTEPLRQVVLKRADAGTIQDLAIREGMETMLEDGAAKASSGITTLEEVLSATGDV